ncbi:DNA cytosine methyltransferase, partial [Thiomonas sp.]
MLYMDPDPDVITPLPATDGHPGFPTNTDEAEESFSVISLFSGCGGMDLGFKGAFSFLGRRYPRNPFDIIWANEINEAACRTYRRNIGPHIRHGDIWSMMDALPDKADVVIGGFPC